MDRNRKGNKVHSKPRVIPKGGGDLSYTIYMDVLFFINFVMDLLLLRFTARLCRQSVVWWRYLIGALAGSVAFLIILWIPFINSRWLYGLIYAGIGMGMCCIAFQPEGIRGVLKCYGCQLMVTLLFGGATNWLYFNTSIGTWLNSMFDKQGLQLGELAILILMAVLILLILTNGYRQLQKQRQEDYYRISLYFEGDNAYGTGFVDTGNFLREPISGKPVVVAEADWLLPILTEPYQQLLNRYIENGKIDYDWIAVHGLTKAKWIPYQVVGEEEKEMLGVQCRKMVLRQKNHCVVREAVIVGVSRTPITNRKKYQVLLHTDIIGEE